MCIFRTASDKFEKLLTVLQAFRRQDYKIEKIHIDFIYGRVIEKGRIGRCGRINRGRAGVWGRSPRQAESLA